jgi:uncharacterized protein YnzC (UPF0291/DUF896 family)
MNHWLEDKRRHKMMTLQTAETWRQSLLRQMLLDGAKSIVDQATLSQKIADEERIKEASE